MSKAKRWRALGRRWRLSDGQVVTSPFPGAKTVEDVGRQCRRSKRNRWRWSLARVPASRRQAVHLVWGRRRRCSLGKEYFRKLWRGYGQFYRRPRRPYQLPHQGACP